MKPPGGYARLLWTVIWMAFLGLCSAGDIMLLSKSNCINVGECGDLPLAPVAFYMGMKDGGGSAAGELDMGTGKAALNLFDIRQNGSFTSLFEAALSTYLQQVREPDELVNNGTSQMSTTAFVGMEVDCEKVASLAIATRVPIISYVCDGNLGEGDAVNDFTIQTATNPYAKYRALTSYLKFMNWTTVGVLFSSRRADDPARSALTNTLKDNGITISMDGLVLDYGDGRNSRSEKYISTLMDLHLKSRIIVADLSDSTSIKYLIMALSRLNFMFAGDHMVLIMSEGLKYSLLGNFLDYWSDISGTYYLPKVDIVNTLRGVVFLTDLETVTDDTYMRFPNFTAALRDLVLNKPLPCPPFCNYVVNATEFYGTEGAERFVDGNQYKDISIEVISAYHSGKLLAETLKRVGQVSDGRTLAAALRNSTFEGLMDYRGTFDKYGVLRKAYNLYTTTAPHIASSTYSPIQVLATQRGRIVPDLADAWRVEQDPVADWNLPGGPTWPAAVPKCGFENEKCPQALQLFSQTEVILIAASGAAALVMLIVIAIIIRWIMYERRLESCYWLIDRGQVILLEHSFAASIGRSNMKSAASFQSSGGLQDLEQHGPSLGTLQFYEQNLREERRNHARPRNPKKKTAFSTEEDDRWYEIIGWKLAKFDGQLVTVRRIEKQTLKLTREMKLELDQLMHINCENLNKVYGLINDRSHIFTIHAFGPRMALDDLLRNPALRLDRMFKVSFVEDVMRGLTYLHNKSKIGCHGNLKSTNCVVDAYWRIRLSNFGMFHLREGEPTAKPDALLWAAPELLRSGMNKLEMGPHALAKADLYSFSIVLYEIFGRLGPWGDEMLDSIEIIEQLKFPRDNEPARPDLNIISKAPQQILDTIKCCWAENPEDRPGIKKVRGKLRVLSKGMRSNIADNIMALLDRYRFNLEDVIKERTEELSDEKRRNEQLLLQLLPRTVAENLKDGRQVEAEHFAAVSIYFSDIVGFTSLSSKSTPLQIVDMLNDLYTQFDTIIDMFDCYKVETIGDAYMFVSGLPLLNGDLHAGEVAGAAFELLERIKIFTVKHYPEEKLRLRIGIHTGPVLTGVVGVRMPRYCLFGDTVITASNMESSGEPMKIQISEPTFKVLDRLAGYNIIPRGVFELKNKVQMKTYWLLDYDRKMRNARVAESIENHPHLKKLGAH